MHITLPIASATEYLNESELERDWEETGKEGLMPMVQVTAIEELIALEHSTYALRRASGGCGSNVDIINRLYNQAKIAYASHYGEKYVSHNGDLIW